MRGRIRLRHSTPRTSISRIQFCHFMSVIDIQSTKLSLQLANIGLSPLYEPLSRWSRPNSLPCCLLLLPPNFPPGKRGLGSNDGIDLSGFEQIPAEKSKVRWQYNWNSDISGNKIAAAEFVPMLWSDRGDHTGQGSRHLLGFNEPDLGSQANMSPGYAAVAWRQWMNPYAGLARLGAPAVSNGGYNWLQQWLSVCSDCHFDFVPIHWYNPHDLEFDLEDWVNCVCRLTGKPVWVTEVRWLRYCCVRIC